MKRLKKLSSLCRFFGMAILWAAACSTNAAQANQAQLISHITHIEKKHNIPAGLLRAIARVESKTRPYCVNAKGRSFCFNSKYEAANFVRNVKQQGYNNISVGCMQLHVPAHGAQFSSLEAMMEPERNIEYSARLLVRLKRRYGTWPRAVERYNSRFSPASRRYKAKVYKAWGYIQPAAYRTHSAPAQPQKKKGQPTPSRSHIPGMTLHPKSLSALRHHIEPRTLHPLFGCSLPANTNSSYTDFNVPLAPSTADVKKAEHSPNVPLYHLARMHGCKTWKRTYAMSDDLHTHNASPCAKLSWMESLKNWMHL